VQNVINGTALPSGTKASFAKKLKKGTTFSKPSFWVSMLVFSRMVGLKNK